MEQFVLKSLEQLLLSQIPDFDAIVFGGADDVVFVGGSPHTTHRIRMRIINLENGVFGFGIPYFDGSVFVA